VVNTRELVSSAPNSMKLSPRSEPIHTQLSLDLHDMAISSVVGSTEYLFKSTNNTALHYTFFSALLLPPLAQIQSFSQLPALQQTNLYSSVPNIQKKKKKV
jgi:hypothetical protein